MMYEKEWEDAMEESEKFSRCAGYLLTQADLTSDRREKAVYHEAASKLFSRSDEWIDTATAWRERGNKEEAEIGLADSIEDDLIPDPEAA